MWATIVSVLGSLPALIKLFSQLIGLVKEIQRAFQKDPIEEVKKGADAQKEAQKRAEEKDDTSGTFGGSSK